VVRTTRPIADRPHGKWNTVEGGLDIATVVQRVRRGSRTKGLRPVRWRYRRKGGKRRGVQIGKRGVEGGSLTLHVGAVHPGENAAREPVVGYQEVLY